VILMGVLPAQLEKDIPGSKSLLAVELSSAEPRL
jgi:hypothetical protein